MAETLSDMRKQLGLELKRHPYIPFVKILSFAWNVTVGNERTLSVAINLKLKPLEVSEILRKFAEAIEESHSETE